MKMAELKILSYNTQGIGGISKRTDIFDFLRNTNCDIYCLQETHFTDTEERSILDLWICAEFLATKIRKNKTIKGISINNIEFKISQYADDTSAMLDDTERSLNQTLEELSRFSKISGLNINFDKTQLVWIGSEKFSTRSIKTKWKLSWRNNQFKLLGILFNTDLDKMIKNNYIPKVTQMEKILKQWNKRS